MSKKTNIIINVKTKMKRKSIKTILTLDESNKTDIFWHNFNWIAFSKSFHDLLWQIGFILTMLYCVENSGRGTYISDGNSEIGAHVNKSMISEDN